MLEDLQAFRAVAELQSFAKAARQLKVSNSVITRRIARLEQHLQIKLLQRSTRQVSLTELGAEYLQQITEILQQLELSYTELKQKQNQVTGVLRMGVPYSILQEWIVPNLATWFYQYPELQLEFIQGNHLYDMISSRYDLIIYSGDLPDTNYYSKHIADWSKMTVASPSFLTRYGIPKEPKDLCHFWCIDHADNYHRGWGYLHQGLYREQVIKSMLRANSSTIMRDMALQGLGITRLPDFTIHHAVTSGELVPVLSEYQLAPLGIHAIYPSKRFLPKKTELFIAFLQDCFAKLNIVR